MALQERELQEKARKQREDQQRLISGTEVEAKTSQGHIEETSDDSENTEDNPSVVDTPVNTSAVNTSILQTTEEPSKPTEQQQPTPIPRPTTTTTMTVLNPSPLSMSKELLEKSLIATERKAKEDEI